MLYRKLGSRVNEEVSALGFGCMRFPTDETTKKIDRTKTFEMLQAAVDGGVNYFDTAWMYHGGESEEAVGEFFSGGLRDKVLLATKLPTWKVVEPADMDRFLDEQRKRLKTDVIDFYLLHALDKKRWAQMRDLGAIEWAQKKRQEGTIRAIGFSFHDNYQAFVDIVDATDAWDFCQIQYNYMNETIQAGTAGFAYAAQKGLGIVIMEPLLGGALATPPPAVAKHFTSTGQDFTPVEHALRWLWDKPDVGTVLSGMSTMEQVAANLEIAGKTPAGCLGWKDQELYKGARALFSEKRLVACTSCQYCMPCPHGVNIPGNFEILNDFAMFGNERQAKFRYNVDMEEESRASACIECAECEPKCPQGIPIIESLKRVRQELEVEKPLVE